MSWEKITLDNVEAFCAKQRAELEAMRANVHRAEDAMYAELDSSNAKRIAAAELPESILAQWWPIERERRRVSRLKLDAWVDSVIEASEGHLELLQRDIHKCSVQ